MPHDRLSTPRATPAARGTTHAPSAPRVERRPAHVPRANYGPPSGAAHAAESVELRFAPDGTGDGVLTTRAFAAGETVMVGYLTGPLTGNDSHATQVGRDEWARHGGLGPKVNHSCEPNCGVRLNAGKAFDFVARRPLAAGQEITFDYAMRNLTVDHFPTVCLCGAAGCRGSVTGWKDLPQARKDAYGELVAPYLRAIDAADQA
ncbi:MAG: SET domain-containing protein [Solirubrobacteraceae bacterium]|nr:SET domain-containing protein [Solirubrobacteraceae bacterium]